MSYDPILKVFKKDYENVSRSNWNWDNKNRISVDYGYLYPVAVYDVTPNTYFKLDLHAVLSSNPTISPILGTIKFRCEAYFVEKAAYVNRLRNNDKLPVDRNILFPKTSTYNSGTISASSPASRSYCFSPATSIFDYLSMYPAGWSQSHWNAVTSGSGNKLDDFPSLNGIPFVMYWDIYRNYYLNVQEPSTPFRVSSFVPSPDETVQPLSVTEDAQVSRESIDFFITLVRDGMAVDEAFEEAIRLEFLPRYTKGGIDYQRITPLDHAKKYHYGLLRRTYNNDFYTSFISNDNVALMKSHSSINVPISGGHGTITTEQISLANRNWRFAVRSLLWGTDWKDYNAVHFGTKLKVRYGKPQFLGAVSSNVVFQDVMNQSQGSGDTIKSELGGRAAVAFGSLTNKTSRKSDYKPFVEFTTAEEGYVMVLLSIVPEVDYYQGVHPMYFKTNLQHSYSPEYNAYGMQDFHKIWASALPYNPSGGVNIVRYREYNTAIHKVPMWYEYMARYNEVHGLFTLENMYRYWTNVRPFTALDFYFNGLESTGLDYYDSTYVLPELFNSQFANTTGTDNFQVQISFDCFVKQLLDKQIIAYL